MGFNSAFDVALLTFAVCLRNVPVCLKFHFKISKKKIIIHGTFFLSKLLDTTSYFLEIKSIDLLLRSLVFYFGGAAFSSVCNVGIGTVPGKLL